MVFISSTKVKSKLKITAHNASTEFGFSVLTLIQKLEELHTTIILMINVTIMETMNHSQLSSVGMYIKLTFIVLFFRENRTKFNPKWEDDDTVLSYSLAINYTFDEELSTAGDPTQIKITTINVPLMVSHCDYLHWYTSYRLLFRSL